MTNVEGAPQTEHSPAAEWRRAKGSELRFFRRQHLKGLMACLDEGDHEGAREAFDQLLLIADEQYRRRSAMPQPRRRRWSRDDAEWMERRLEFDPTFASAVFVEAVYDEYRRDLWRATRHMDEPTPPLPKDAFGRLLKRIYPKVTRERGRATGDIGEAIVASSGFAYFYRGLQVRQPV